MNFGIVVLFPISLNLSVIFLLTSLTHWLTRSMLFNFQISRDIIFNIKNNYFGLRNMPYDLSPLKLLSSDVLLLSNIWVTLVSEFPCVIEINVCSVL